MHLDVQDLRDFYYRNPLGRVAQQVIRSRVADVWPDAKGQFVAGYGFSVPLLRPFLGQARRVMALMPGPQGVMPWPAGQPNISILTEETAWPVETGHVDKLIVMHGLETSDHPAAVLEECWRILGPGGRALFIVPHRAGLWARRDRTPFGYGRPYTLGQLETQLRVQGFLPERHEAMMYMPPSSSKFWMRTGRAVEKIGRKVSVLAGGVLMVEVSKRSPPIQGTPVGETARVSLGVLSPKPKTAPA